MSDTQTNGVLVTVKEAARHLGMAPSSLYRLCADRKVPAYSVGAKGYGVRVDIEELKQALRRPIKTGTEQNITVVDKKADEEVGLRSGSIQTIGVKQCKA